MNQTDPNVESVRSKLLQRSQVGIKKYGCTTAQAGLAQLQWMKHLQEELLDAAVYLEAMMNMEATPKVIKVEGGWCKREGKFLECNPANISGSGFVPVKATFEAIDTPKEPKERREWKVLARDGCIMEFKPAIMPLEHYESKGWRLTTLVEKGGGK